MLCEYGCGETGSFILKNGKRCCNQYTQQCLSIKLKNSTANKGKAKAGRAAGAQISNNKKTICKYCKREYSITGIKSHEEHCYMNPKNRKDCPVCNIPIKNYKINKTCSSSCGNKINQNLDCISKNTDKSIHYQLVCFNTHGKKCIICDEDLLIDVHHLDGDRCNNSSENLIPVCPTHHKYCHHVEYWYIIKECIDDYIEKFKARER